jgi:hypothetical protein
VGIVIPPSLPLPMPALVGDDPEDAEATRLADSKPPRKPIARSLTSMPSIDMSRSDSRPDLRAEVRATEARRDAAPVEARRDAVTLPPQSDPRRDAPTLPPQGDVWADQLPTKPKSGKDSVPSLPRLPQSGLVWQLRTKAKHAAAWLRQALFADPDRRRRSTIVGVATLLSLALVFVLGRHADSDDVKLWVRGLPEGATLTWGDTPLHENPAHVPRSSESKKLTIVSPGYQTVHVALVPTRDIEFTVELRSTP